VTLRQAPYPVDVKRAPQAHGRGTPFLQGSAAGEPQEAGTERRMDLRQETLNQIVATGLIVSMFVLAVLLSEYGTRWARTRGGERCSQCGNAGQEQDAVTGAWMCPRCLKTGKVRPVSGRLPWD
jgi:hypothetical protein